MSYNNSVGIYSTLRCIGPGIALSACCMLTTPLQADAISQPTEVSTFMRAGQVPLPDHCEDPDCPGKNSNKELPSLTVSPNPDVYIPQPFRYGESSEAALSSQAQLVLWVEQALWNLLWN